MLLAGLAWCVPAQASISRNGFCTATGTSCTRSATSTGDLVVSFAFRSGSTTAPSLPGSNTSITTIATSAGGTVGSIRVACRRASSGSDTGSGTFTNATSVASISYSGTAVVSTASCNAVGIAIGGNGCGTATDCWAKTSTTTTYKGITLSDPNNNSWIIGFMAGSASSTCTPASLTSVSGTGTILANDSNATVSSFADDTCTVSSETWMSYTLEIISSCVNLNLGNNWTSIQCAMNQVANATTVTATFASNVTAGNMVAVLVLNCVNGTGCASGTPTTISSITGTAVTGASCETDPGLPVTTTFHKLQGKACPGVAGTTVIANFGGTAQDFPEIQVVELNYSGGSGTPASAFYASNGSGTSGSGTTATIGLTINAATDVFFCATDLDAANAITPGTNFRQISQPNGFIGLASEAKTNVSGAQNGTSTFGSTGWRIWCSDLAPTTAGGGTTATPQQMLSGIGD